MGKKIHSNSPFKYPPPPPPLSKHGQGQKNNGHTGFSCLDKPVLARGAQHKKTLQVENLLVPHTKHNSHKHGTRAQCVGKTLHGPHVVTAHQHVWKPFPILRCVLNSCTCFPSGAGFGAGLAVSCAGLVWVRHPNLPLMVMGMGCQLGSKHDQKGHDAQAHAHSSCTSLLPKSSQRIEGPTMVAGACSPVDRMYMPSDSNCIHGWRPQQNIRLQSPSE